MQRVEAAIRDGRCVLAVGGRALQTPDVQMELRRRSVRSVALGSDPVNPTIAISPEALAPCTDAQGGILVLVEPESQDGAALGELARIVEKAKNKPRLYVAARAFNPFSLPMSLRLLKLEHLKLRAQDFIASLPVGGAPEAVAEAAPAEKKGKADKTAAARPLFVGREEELPALRELLAQKGGPIVLVGPQGVGKRWLAERAIAESGHKRLTDLHLHRGVGGDTLLGRIAIIAKENDNGELLAALHKTEDPLKPAELAELAVKALQTPSLEKTAWLVTGLEHLLDRRNGTFYRQGRLEMVLEALLKAELAITLVFTSTLTPRFYREGDGRNIRTLTVAGLQGKLLHELFEAYHTPEFPRDRFGPIVDRTHGHPIASRCIALQVLEGTEIDDILEAPKLLKAESLEDLEPLERHLKRKVEAVKGDLRKALSAAAHLPIPLGAHILQGLGINRNTRAELLNAGLLEQTPALEDRGYYVHPLVREHLKFQEVADFDLLEECARLMNEDAKKADPITQAALRQEINRMLVEARRTRNLQRVPFPDNDAYIDGIRSILRRKQPRLDIARMKVNELLKTDTHNPELHLCNAELLAAEKAPQDKILAAYDEAAKSPTPEVFHQLAHYWMDKNSRGKAAAALQQGLQAFPADARMLRRMAGLLMSQNKLEEAVAALKTAQELEPMMPDSYGMIGEIYVLQGPPRWEDARAALDEARRLDPQNPSHLWRLALLLRGMGIQDAERREALWDEAQGLLEEALKLDGDHARSLTLLGRIMLDRNASDMDRVEWLLNKAGKSGKFADVWVEQARVLIRKAQYKEAEDLVEKALKKDGSLHEAFAAKGELWSAQGQVFLAFDAYKHAKERSQKDAPERTIYDAMLTQLSQIIEAGVAADLMRPPERKPQAEALEGGDGPRREPGSTVRRRRGRRGGGGAEGAGDEASAEAAGQESAADTAPASDGAGAPAPATPVEAAPAETSAPATPVEAAPSATPDTPPAAESEPQPEPAPTPEA